MTRDDKEHDTKPRKGEHKPGPASGMSDAQVKSREPAPPGKGRPDAEEGVGTGQNRKG